MHKTTNLIIYNHDYHLKNILNFDNQRIIQINIKTKYPLFESLNFFNLLFRKYKLKNQLKNELENINELIIYGCQDYLSWYLYRIAKNKKIKIKVVPDNLEFFLRPIQKGYSKLNFKKLVKIFLFNLYKFKLNSDYSFFQNRIIYKIEKKDIDLSKSFFFNVVIKSSSKTNSDSIVFISQPYYIDYNISVDTWGIRTESYLSTLQKKGFKVFIKYHQRDSLKFKGFMNSCGFSEVDDSLKTPKKYIGLFSTYLFELSLNNFEVFSCFNYFKNLFPQDYIKFVNIITENIPLNLNAEKQWIIKKNDFTNLLNSTFK